jgi:hypothetical protein
MRHIKQKLDNDCGLAAAAMFAGSTYNKAGAFDPNPESPIGVSSREMLVILGGLGVRAHISKRLYRVPLALADAPDGCLLVIREDGKSYGHWVCIKDGLVFDPEMKRPLPMSEYERRHWRVILVFTKQGGR